jgi:hypothetical protein
MRRRKLWWSLAALPVLAGLFLVYRWTRRPDWSGAAGIRLDMTRAEVEALLGCPPGDYGTHEPEPVLKHSWWPAQTVEHHGSNVRGITSLRWTDDDHALVVFFQDESGRAVIAVRPEVEVHHAGRFDAFGWRIGRVLQSRFP